MHTNTLTSLAILRVTVDQGGDYLDYLRPLILQVLVDHESQVLTAAAVAHIVNDSFGLKIPERSVAIVLKRIARRYRMRKDHGAYHIREGLPDPQIATKLASTESQIADVIHGFRQFSEETPKPIHSDADAILAITTFLAEFDVTCLRAFLRDTTIPDMPVHDQTDVVLVSKYVQHVRQHNTDDFARFLVLVQGHMLANALLCPDLQKAPKSYKDVVFFLDTPLLVQRLGLEGVAKKDAVRELVALVHDLGGTVAAFSHTRDELRTVLQGAASYVDRPAGRGAIVYEARRRGTTRSDLILLAETVDEQLERFNIKVKQTPPYLERFQIDETVFEGILEDEVGYHNPRAREYDINSVRSIYAIRGDLATPSIEKARAVIVTSNRAYAQAAWDYGGRFHASEGVSSVITDFTLANIAWLKTPMRPPSIPATQLLAFSFAALEPSTELLNRYYDEIERLQEKGNVTERDHQLLRSSPLAYEELVHTTLGNAGAISEESIAATLERVSDAIAVEQLERLRIEEQAHEETRSALGSEQRRNQDVISNLYWGAVRRARRIAIVPSVTLGVLLVGGVMGGMGLQADTAMLGLVMMIGFGAMSALTLANLVFGSTVKDLHRWLQKRILKALLKRLAKEYDVEFDEYQDVLALPRGSKEAKSHPFVQ